MDIHRFPDWYKKYNWQNKHSLFGYAPDRYPTFEWIRSLERRFLHYRQCPDSAPLYLVREMIQWGGSQNGVLEKFDNELGSYCLNAKLNAVLRSLELPKAAIDAALDIPGLGLTYASKLLRFLDPDKYGALDGRIRKALGKLSPSPLPIIHDSYNKSRIEGYCAFSDYLVLLKGQLQTNRILLPSEQGQVPWRAADIEMALFQWASSQANNS